MFQSLKNLDAAHQQNRRLVKFFLLLCFAIVALVVYSSRKTTAEALSRVMILDQGRLLSATAYDAQENRPVEAQNHVKRFHEFFFTLDPDDKAIEHNVSQSLYLADASAKREYENLKESGYYNDLIQANISQDITVDSVRVRPSGGDYYATCYAQQQIIRARSVTTRSLISECYLRDVLRSTNNPHGFLIERWRVLENKDIQTTAR